MMQLVRWKTFNLSMDGETVPLTFNVSSLEADTIKLSSEATATRQIAFE